MKYHIAGGREPIVEFTCPTCLSSLQSPLQDAGQQFGCPTCAHVLIVPGIAERMLRSEFERKRIAGAEERRRVAEVRAAEELQTRTAKADYEHRKLLEKEAKRREKAGRPKAGVSTGSFAATLMLLVLVMTLVYWGRLRPLQEKLDLAEVKLADAERKIRGMESDLESLTRTVNHNAEVANFNNRLR